MGTVRIMTGIRVAAREDIPALYALYTYIGKKDAGYFEHLFDMNAEIILHHDGDVMTGFCILNWQPRYSLYRRLNIPEIQDINVLPEHRRNGYARAMIKWCEGTARARGCDAIGISVGLTRDYGPAQILYTKLGYIPDGFGVTYDREAVTPFKAYPLDDDLALMMIKELI